MTHDTDNHPATTGGQLMVETTILSTTEHPEDPPPAGLTATERTILDIESAWWKSRGAKANAIYERLAMRPVRYYQALNALLKRADAIEYAAATVLRLKRIRDDHRRWRSV